MAEVWTWGTVESKVRGGLEAFIQLCNVRFKRLEVLLSQLRGAVFGPPVVYAHLMPGADWGAKVTAAVGALPSTGGIVDARGLTGTQVLSANLTFDTDYVTILVGPAAIAAAAYTITVSAGTHGFRMQGMGPWAGLGGTPGSGMSYFTYSGTSDFFTVGASSAETDYFQLRDIGIDTQGSASGARALVLKRVILFDVDRPRLYGGNKTSSVGLVCDGTGGFTGHGRIVNPHITNFATQIYGTGSGASGMNHVAIVGGAINGTSSQKGLVIDAGDSVHLDGPDFENLSVAIETNRRLLTGVGVRCEGNTTDLSLLSGANRNNIQFAAGSTASTFLPIVSDTSGQVNNSVWFTDFQQAGRSVTRWRNLEDATMQFQLGGGSASEQDVDLDFLNRTATALIRLRKAANGNFDIRDVTADLAFLQYVVSSGNLQLGGTGTGAVQLNGGGTGTGGVLFYDGAASPTLVASLSAAGKLTLAGEAEIDGALNHDGSTAGFFGVTPVSRASALTQTYSTADRTLAAYTPDSESGAYTGVDNLQVGSVYATVADLNALRVAYENLRAFTEDVAQHHNAVVDDLQAYGLEQ